ncbi:MAG: TonB-dependent receptor [Flavobacteriales bacterium]|nr:TonB-dependent receptor [Flavobacteriales bacterium]
MKVYFTVFASFLIVSISAQTLISPAEVKAYRLDTPAQLVTGVFHEIDSLRLHGFASSDLSQALNSIPSVKMETRGDGGSRRLSVRGSSLRSPYSVRNTMLFSDGFVLTEADGNSPLELIDPDIIQSVNFVTGPSAASYGGAYGGALQIFSRKNLKTGMGAWAHLQVGSTGGDGYENEEGLSFAGINSRFSAGVSQGFERGVLNVSMVLTDNPGYRDWEWNRKQQFNLSGSFYDKSGGIHTVLACHYDGSWALPGAIKQSQVDTLPTASPGIDYNAHVDRVRDMVGYKYERKTSNGWDLSASVLGRNTTKANPYGTSPFYSGYKEESGSGYGLLASGSKKVFKNDTWGLDFEVTLMQLNDIVQITEWDDAPSPLAVIIPMRYDLKMNAQQNFVSTSWVATVGDNLRFETQMSFSNRTRNTNGSLYTDIDEAIPYLSDKSHVTFLPRIGASWELKPGYSVFAQASTGFSDPTAFELVNPEDGQIADLESESAFGAETGIRAQLSNDLNVRLTFYHQTVNSAIMQIVQDNDAVAFENVEGGLEMNGIEFELNYNLLEHLKLRAYGALSLHSFGDETPYAGNALPGSPKSSGGLQVWSQHKWGSINLDSRYIAETPLNNLGTSVMESYVVMNASVVLKLPKNIVVEMGAKNLLNSDYSDWPQLNGVYGKFYNPAPPRTAYVSIRWSI